MTRIVRWISALAIACAVATPALAQSNESSDLRSTVETMLAGFEKTATDPEWQALGPEAVPHLLAIARDEAGTRSTRARAINALGNFPSPEVVGYLAGLLAPGGDSTLQRKALRSLARTGGEEQLTLIAGYLEHEDTVLREAAAHALGIVGTDAARQALQTRRAVETSTAVQKAIDEELAR